MSDRNRADSEPGDVERPEFVIPDGGLGTSMPEWLLQRPDWAAAPASPDASDIADALVKPVVEPTHVTVAAVGKPLRELPPPDTSPIQLSDVLEVDDLPAWLRAIAERAERERAEADNATLPAVPSSTVPAETDVLDTSESDVAVETVLVTETMDVPPERAEGATAPVSIPQHPVWLSDKVVGALIAAVVLLLIYVLLTLTNVI